MSCKGIGFYLGIWDEWPYQGMFEKDYYVSSMKDGSDRDLKHEEPLIDTKMQRAGKTVHISEPSKMFIELKWIEEVCWNFSFSVSFLENVNSSYSLGCFKVLPPNPSEGEITEVWVSDPSHHESSKMSSNTPLQMFPLFKIVFIGIESYAAVWCTNSILLFAIEFIRYLNYYLYNWANKCVSNCVLFDYYNHTPQLLTSLTAVVYSFFFFLGHFQKMLPIK